MTVQLSNFLCDRADVAGDAFRGHKRASRESIELYLKCGNALVEARDGCKRRGEWGAVLERARIEPRTARYMVQIARAGATADDIERAGGLRAYRESLAEKAEPGSANGPGEPSDTAPVEPPATSHGATHPTPPEPEDPRPGVDSATVHLARPTGEGLALSPSTNWTLQGLAG